jgi:hypothetical protein
MTAPEILVLIRRCAKSEHREMVREVPAHADNSPCLSVMEGEKGILLKCFSGCTLHEITTALGLEVSDLFTDAPPLPKGQRVLERASRLDPRALAFRFDLYALELRMRAERVLQALAHLPPTDRNDSELDRLIQSVASAYHDLERADLFEHVTHTLQWQIYQERTMRHAA